MKRTASFALILIFISSLVQAQQVPYFDKEAYIASADTDKKLELRMADCIDMALKNNSEIKVTRLLPPIANSNMLIERGKFEPTISANLLMGDMREQSSNTLNPVSTAKTRTGVFNFGYDQLLTTGTAISLDWYNARSWSNSSLQSINPLYDSAAEVSITQPLLKGFGLTVNKAYYLVAKNNKVKSKQDLAREMMNILTDVKKSYYDFQYYQEARMVAEASLKRVQDLYEINKERFAKGLASDVDLLEAEAETLRYEQAYLAADAAVQTAEDSLKLITNIVDDPQLWNCRIMSIDPLGYKKYETDLVASIEKAYAYRPDYEAAKIDLRNRDIMVVYNKNGMLPQVDLVGSYGLNGIDKLYGKSLGHVGGGQYYDWAVGLNVTMPLVSDKEKGNYDKSKLEKIQSLILFKRLEEKIIFEVRDAVRKVETRYKMLEASRKTKEVSEKEYAAQDKRFRAGLVSTHDIIDYQERLTLALVNYERSIVEYNTAIAELSKTEGVMLMEENIVVE